MRTRRQARVKRLRTLGLRPIPTSQTGIESSSRRITLTNPATGQQVEVELDPVTYMRWQQAVEARDLYRQLQAQNTQFSQEMNRHFTEMDAYINEVSGALLRQEQADNIRWQELEVSARAFSRAMQSFQLETSARIEDLEREVDILDQQR